MRPIARTADHAGAAPALRSGALVSRLRVAASAVIARRQTRHVVQGLSDAQRRDTGIDAAAVLGNRPVIDVDARLASYLASLR